MSTPSDIVERVGCDPELIAWAEKATGPDRGLDWGIHLRNGSAGVGMYGDHPHYTASIDAALTLIPKGMFWLLAVGRVRHDEPLAGFSIVSPDDLDNPIAEAEGDSLALCICIAALKATGATP